MVVIYPQKIETENSENKLLYTFADLLKKYMKERGGESELSRKSVDAPDVNPLILKSATSASVFLGLYLDGITGTTYAITCDAYSALVGTINNLLAKELGDPVGNGLDINGTLNYSTVNDIILHLPDSIKEYSEDKLDSLARKIIEAGFWYPIKSLNIHDKDNIYDPYFYRIQGPNAWHEEVYQIDAPDDDIKGFKLGQNYNGSNGEIKEDRSDKEHIIRYLHIDSKVSGTYTAEIIGQDEEGQDITDDPPLQHYTWSIPVTSLPQEAHTLIVSAKGSGTVYIKIGPEGARYYTKNHRVGGEAIKDTSYFEYVEELNSPDAYKKIEVPIPLDINDITSIELGVEGTGIVDYTAVWVTESPSEYNIYPQGYRDEIQPEKQETVPDKPCEALTSAASFEDRAKDKIEPPKPIPEQDKSEDPSGGKSLSSPEGFSNAISDIISQITSTAAGVAGLVSLASLMKLDTTAMSDAIKNELNFEKKIKTAKIKDKLDSVKDGAQQQAEELEKAKKESIKCKSMALSPDKLKEAARPKVPEVPSIPTKDVTDGIQLIKDKAAKQNELLKNNTANLTESLKPELSINLKAAQDAVNKTKEETEKVRDIIEKNKAQQQGVVV